MHELVEQLPTVLQDAGIPGLTLAIIEGGEITVEKTVGRGVAADGMNVTPETLFEAASLTKPVFAYGVLRLVERGDIDLDAPLTSYFEFTDVVDDDRVHAITARIVLSHTTGFPNWRRDRPLTIGVDPGTQFGYSGEGFVFLQRAVEAITGQPMAAWLPDEVLTPLEMTNSYLYWDEKLAARTATGHDFLQEPKDKWKPEEGIAASSLHTTAGDYARFVAEMMHPTLVTSATLDAMLTPISHPADGVHWGLGWGLEDATRPDGSVDTMLWHWGSNGWFKCFVVASRAQQRGVVFFTNSENGAAITEQIVEAVLPGRHPSLIWRSFGTYDSAAFRIRVELARAGIDGGADGVRKAFDALDARYPREAFDENMMNGLGYQLLQREDVAAAVEVFRLNVELYPDSWNGHDSLGEGLREQGKKEEAIASYERSLALNPDNTNGTTMLEELRAR